MDMKYCLLAAVALIGSVGCGGYARTPDQWTDDTTKLLDAQSETIRACYEKTLKGNPKLQGQVTVSFIVEDKTGRVRKAKIDTNRTTAGDPVRKCVLDALRDLKLTPPDEAQGRASFQWDFHPIYIKEDGTPLETAPPGT